MIQLAGRLEVAAFWPGDQPDAIRTMLHESGKKRNSLLEQLRGLAEETAPFLKLHDLVQALSTSAQEYERSGFRDGLSLLQACSLVGS